MTDDFTGRRRVFDDISLAAVLQGTPGDDVLAALGEGDSLFGLAGRDRLTSLFNHTRLDGGRDDDRLSTTVAVSASAEDPAVVSAYQNGGNGNDRLTLTLAAEARFGLSEIDVTALGGGGNDDIRVTLQTSSIGLTRLAGVIDGGLGDDTIRVDLRFGGSTFGDGEIDAPLRIEGGSGDDSITVVARSIGAAVPTQTFGGRGDDVIRVDVRTTGEAFLTGIDTFVDGGAGNDRIYAASQSAAAPLQIHRLFGGDGNDRVRSVQTGVDFGRFNFLATLDGGDGNDRLAAVMRAEADDLRVDIRAALRGGNGDDNISAVATIIAGMHYYSTSIIRLDGGAGNDSLLSNLTIEGAIWEDFSSQHLLSGGSGDDRLQVIGRGANILDGGQGADVMIGGIGDDTYYVDDLGDVTLESRSASGGQDAVFATVSHRLGEGIETLTLMALAENGFGNSSDNVITGTVLANQLRGGAGNDRLEGFGGDDLLLGGTGNDHLLGGDGADRLEGGAGDDRLEGGDGDDVLLGGAGNDHLIGGGGVYDLLDGGDGDDVLEGGQFARLYGGAGDDRLSGGSNLWGGDGNDVLSGLTAYGEAGDDVLIGGRLFGGDGNDRLTPLDWSSADGGAGVDTIVLDVRGTERRLVSIVFDRAEDRLEFRGIADRGAPGLLDDLDAATVFENDEDLGWVVRIGRTNLWITGLTAATDSFADLVDDPDTQLLAWENPLV